MRWVQGHQQVMLAPSEWWQVEGYVYQQRESCWNQGYTARLGGFIVTQASCPPISQATF